MYISNLLEGHWDGHQFTAQYYWSILEHIIEVSADYACHSAFFFLLEEIFVKVSLICDDHPTGKLECPFRSFLIGSK